MFFDMLLTFIEGSQQLRLHGVEWQAIMSCKG